MKNKYIILLLIFIMVIICGCSNNSEEIVVKSSDDPIIIENDDSSFSLENTVWTNTGNGSIYYFYSKSNKINFKEKTSGEIFYEGYYTLTTNEKEVTKFKELFEASNDSLKEHFNENTQSLKNAVEFGLATNTDEHESIIHEYYGLYTDHKIILAEVGSNDIVFVLERKN